MTKRGTLKFYENVDWQRIERVTDKEVKEYLRNVHTYLLNNIKGKVLVLEVGCGTGDFIRELANQVEKIVGIDVSRRLMQKAKNNLRGIRNIRLITADIDDAKVPKNYFDFIISMWTLPNIDNPVSFIRKMKRTLKNDGHIFIDTYSEKATKVRTKMYKNYGLTVLGHNKKNIIIKEGLTEKIYTKNDLESLFRHAGLSVEVIEIHKLGYLCKASKTIRK